MLEVLTFANAAEAEASCARALSDALGAALASVPGRVSFMVSGGNTPRRVLPLVLAEDLNWDRIDVFASDERLVPVEHPDSTEGMVRKVFATANRPLNYIGFGPDTTPQAALTCWQSSLKSAAWPVAAGFIGIGEDAHFASLFPGRSEIIDADLFAAAVPETLPHQHARLTLGRAAFGLCNLLTLVVSGEGKLQALNECLTSETDPQIMPAGTIGERGRAIAYIATQDNQYLNCSPYGTVGE